MSVGYLIGLVLWAVVTALAWRPVARPRPLARLSYFLGMTVNELPHVAALILLASTAWALVQGDLDPGSPDGVVALVLVASTVAGQLALLRRAGRASATVVEALDAGLGAGSGPAGPGWRRLLTPLPWRPRSVVRRSGLRYGPARRQRLDVLHARGDSRGRPVLVYLHGGGYVSGSRRWEAQSLLHRFAAKGWVCLSASYRLRAKVGWPDHLVDAKQVIAWARANAGAYGGDPTTLVVAGSSAGGHLAAIAALSPGHSELQPGFEDASVSAVVGLYGFYGRYYGRGPDESPVSTPLGFPAVGAPPFFLVHGANDTYVAPESARELASHLRSAPGAQVVHAELPGAQHGFDLFRSVRFEAVVDGIEVFLARVLGVRARR